MAFNGSGTFVRVHDWETDKANSVKITASRMDAEFDGIATGLSNCVTRDGQSPATANLPMGGYLITGLGTADSGDDAMSRDASDARYLQLASGQTVTGATTFSGALTCSGGVTFSTTAISSSADATFTGGVTFSNTAVTCNVDVTFGTSAQCLIDDSTTAAGAALPFAFDGDEDTGLFRAAADTLGFATGAAEAFRITSGQDIRIGTSTAYDGRLVVSQSTSSGIQSSGTTDASQIAAFIAANVGSGGAGIHLGTTTSTGAGWLQVRDGGNFATNYDLAIQPNGGATTIGGALTTGGVVQVPNGSVSAPSYAFENDGDTGIYWTSTPAINMAISGVQEFVLTGTSFLVQNVYDDSVVGTANVNVASNGRLRQATSSIRFKKDVETIWDSVADAVLKVRPTYYKAKNPDPEIDNPTHSHIGFIAEEVAEIEPRLIHWNKIDGKLVPWGVQYDKFTPLLCNIAQRHDKRIKQLEETVASLQAAIAALVQEVNAS